ncbi:MAG: RNA polymerase sigma factor SigC [Microcoleus sp. PH2017_29_MFU_D_A]|jgi:RNA polymerase nonessential primary-like sigma factor|uniref:RNA polymerase sigma factor SigC n=1 Tax=unclassified Microcoleus TaxID=2642155 RepID=UPI001DFBBB60|nr:MULTISPECIES: RNA polymerase sigma factor SigC [unclassified Microcoleus]MCC3421735.1 RNA polymerase sigma factor SigC [Microcoleus sp. PH2017_07_MST_O_A]MCC3431715.1 RNA polymerase sigma factor SigC [Microcoleus sp. PH2017_04_SCI_O_A]MCC3444038.1 RNA polymerase sigma factor SigC [Microcoleus sp. PH2017_03_ELD_O_A]MCC3468698.1 RNA polymerase sigma factor SigC [Microcoleus sp. PH2017_06_SFM_O_A]MCC3506440.1 RNA polymerase sigma factor SigC [Microcoleus sp. PH2017_19_SFW_U_A]MCC3513105.1 RNA
MPATSFYAQAEFDEQLRVNPLQDVDVLDEDAEEAGDEPIDQDSAETEDADTASKLQKNASRRTTDLVRLYLQEIGRVRLLGRDEEVSEAQKVQRYIKLLELRNTVASQEEGLIQSFVHLIEVRDRLSAQLGHKPSLERWALTAGISDVPELKRIMAEGKRQWAELAEMTVEAIEKIQAEGIEAKDHMIKANLRLVVSVAKKYQNRGLELLDLIQEGTLGLERAVEKFDPTRGYRFSTYAYWWIRQGITRAIATQSRTIRLPVHITEKLNKIKKAQRKISQEKGRTATIEDIGVELDMTAAQVREVLLRVPRSVSLETKVGNEKDTELGDLLETDSISPEEMLMREALHRDLQQLLADLTSRERDVILMRFGLGDGHPYSLAEIGRALDLSRERVRQIEAKALQKLRQPKRRNRVRDYLESLT